jgi:hypothetical protein
MLQSVTKQSMGCKGLHVGYLSQLLVAQDKGIFVIFNFHSRETKIHWSISISNIGGVLYCWTCIQLHNCVRISSFISLVWEQNYGG